MPNYLVINLDTQHQLVAYSGKQPDLFADMVKFANKTAKKLQSPVAVMGQPFFDESIHGNRFKSELYVAQP